LKVSFLIEDAENPINQAQKRELKAVNYFDKVVVKVYTSPKEGIESTCLGHGSLLSNMQAQKRELKAKAEELADMIEQMSSPKEGIESLYGCRLSFGTVLSSPKEGIESQPQLHKV